MKKLQVYFLCLFGICCVFVDCHTIERQDSSIDLKKDTDDNDHAYNYDKEKFPLSFPRYSKLIDAYLDLIHPDREDTRNISVRDSRNRNTYLNEEGLYENHAGSEEYAGQPSTSDVRKRENDGGFVPAKRQQGWYIPYGKRSINSLPSHDMMQKRTNVPVKRQQGWYIPYGKRSINSLLSHDMMQKRTNVPVKRQQGWYIPYGKRSINSLPSHDMMQKRTNVPVKREQGWYIQYGKRSINDLPSHGMMQKRTNDEDTYLDLIQPDREDIRNIPERDSIETNGFSNEEGLYENHSGSEEYAGQPSTSDVRKRENDGGFVPVKRQQGWYIPYGKRSINSAPPPDMMQKRTNVPVKRQQGWYIPYGKRSINYLQSHDMMQKRTNDENTYLDLIQPDREDIRNIPVRDSRKENGFSNEEGLYENQAGTEEYPGQPSTSDVRKRENDGGFVPVKRQQGWYIQYGKRSRNSLPSHDLMQKRTNVPVKREQGWYIQYGKRSRNFLPSHDMMQKRTNDEARRY